MVQLVKGMLFMVPKGTRSFTKVQNEPKVLGMMVQKGSWRIKKFQDC